MPLLSGFLGGIYAMVAAMVVISPSPVEVTVLSAMALVAHNLIVECAVQHRAGTPWYWVLAVRLLGSILLGIAVAWSLAGLAALHLPVLWLRVVSSPQTAVPPSAGFRGFILLWLRDSGTLILKVAVIVTAMMIVTEWIRSRGILARLERGCRPALRFFGLADSVAYLWLTAQILGVAYGSGLIIEEMRDNHGYEPRAVRDLHTSIGISHSLFEDTILLVALGASLFWIIVPRLLLAALAVRLLAGLPFGLRSPAAVWYPAGRGNPEVPDAVPAGRTGPVTQEGMEPEP